MQNQSWPTYCLPKNWIADTKVMNNLFCSSYLCCSKVVASYFFRLKQFPFLILKYLSFNSATKITGLPDQILEFIELEQTLIYAPNFHPFIAHHMFSCIINQQIYAFFYKSFLFDFETKIISHVGICFVYFDLKREFLPCRKTKLREKKIQVKTDTISVL